MNFHLLMLKELVKDQRNGAKSTHIGKFVTMEKCSLLLIFLTVGCRFSLTWGNWKGITNLPLLLSRTEGMTLRWAKPKCLYNCSYCNQNYLSNHNFKPIDWTKSYCFCYEFFQVKWKGDAGKININGTDYKLLQCHWHSPSEHTFNGSRFFFFPFFLFLLFFCLS